MAESVLSPAQFKVKVRKDPNDSADVDHGNGGRPHFGGTPGQSKTMKPSGGRLPKPPVVHPHHRKSGKRSHRIK